MNRLIKVMLGFAPDADESTVRTAWKTRTKHVCKPCWELKYCPYGPLVEQFPLLGPTRSEAVDHNQYLISELASGTFKGARLKEFKQAVERFDAGQYPEAHNRSDVEKECSVFGHLCPVFF